MKLYFAIQMDGFTDKFNNTILLTYLKYEDYVSRR